MIFVKKELPNQGWIKTTVQLALLNVTLIRMVDAFGDSGVQKWQTKLTKLGAAGT